MQVFVGGDMVDRITKNENMYDSIIPIIKKIGRDLEELESKKDAIESVNKYYGNKDWFYDKESFEKGMISNIKAGVLSEDAIWNMDEDFEEIISQMKSIIEWWGNNRFGKD